MSDRILLEVKQNVAVVTLNHQEKYNSLDMPMFRAIVDVAEQLKTNRQIRAVILQGTGKAFCTGLDVKDLMKKPSNIGELLKKPGGRADNLVQRVALIWREIPVPVIAVTQGFCLGGGLQIALGADFRYTTPDCKFSILEGKWGLIPDMGATVLLRELISIDLAKELTMTARVFNGLEAKEMNLVTHVSETPFDEAWQFAQTLAQKSPDTVNAAKRMYNEAWLADERTALDWETTLQKELLGSWNQLSAALANFLPFKLPFKRRRKA